MPPDVALKPTLVYLHALGSSRRAFDETATHLDTFDVLGIDLPGFGDTSPAIGTSVEETANFVVRRIAEAQPTRWMLVGHSMGGKIASVVARRALDGEPGLFGLCGVALLAASPPYPEPMDESRRAEMIAWMHGERLDEASARAFVEANTGIALSGRAEMLALDDLQRTSREGWLDWLERGSREDWSARVGVLDMPAIVLAGENDGDLGVEGQRATNMHVYPRAELVIVPGAKHLLPLEAPDRVATAIAEFWERAAGVGPAVPSAFARLIASQRVSRRMRAALATRALADSVESVPRILGRAQLETLRAIAARVVPQDGAPIDLAARLDRQLAAGGGDGWRFDDMPPDATAYAEALDVLRGFAERDVAAQDALLAAIAAGDGPESPTLSAAQLRRWFEDARADLVRLWLAHPATMAAIGFDGFANGGDGERKQGFVHCGAGEREAWEPRAEGAAA